MTRPRHFTYANIASTLALVVALGGGTAYAAQQAQLAKDSVTTTQIKDGTIQNVDLGAGQVSASKLANSSVTGGKVAKDTLTGAQINEGSLGTVPLSNRAQQVMAAAVSGDGTLLATQSYRASSVTRYGPGLYHVYFTQDLSNCSFVGSSAVANGAANLTGYDQLVDTFYGPDATNEVTVVSWDLSEATASDSSFMVVVVC